MSTIQRVEVHVFSFETENLGLGKHSAAGVGNMIYLPGSKLKSQRFAVRIRCDDGVQGEYVTHWVGTPSTLGQVQMLAPNLIGRDPEEREDGDPGGHPDAVESGNVAIEEAVWQRERLGPPTQLRSER